MKKKSRKLKFGPNVLLDGIGVDRAVVKCVKKLTLLWDLTHLLKTCSVLGPFKVIMSRLGPVKCLNVFTLNNFDETK